MIPAEVRVPKVLTLALCVFSTLIAVPSARTQQEPSKEQQSLQDLFQQGKTLGVKLEASQKVGSQIARSEQRLAGMQAALDRAKRQAREKQIGLVDEAKDIRERADQAGCPWGGTSTNADFVSACNQQGARLTKLWNDLKDRAGALQEYTRQLDLQQRELSDGTLAMSAKKKSNNADQAMIAAAIDDWHRRYNAFVFHSSAYEQLKRVAPGSKVCEIISQPATDEALRSAVDCLEHLMDGLR